ncbi:hypothetical protein RclHR1_03710012 [Rhizophagus clarus]|uniref:Myb-like domain-containing protein n=1 Tax=Rhizophagus clarus TaxID=94130 RepID=A0A2Z6RC21_9GLOM|nr:hypothetical protein RclHR1_03710012 [Rhizophagus clarus]
MIASQQVLLITHHEYCNQEIPSPFDAIDVDQSSTRSTSTFVNFNTPANKSTNRWTSSETRILIEDVAKQRHALQKVKDARERERIWDRIVANIQTSNIVSLALKERAKASIQQKWDELLQKYRDVKDIIERTGEDAVQND